MLKAQKRQQAIAAEMEELSLKAQASCQQVDEETAIRMEQLLVDNYLITMREQYRVGVPVEEIVSLDRAVAIAEASAMEMDRPLTPSEFHLVEVTHVLASAQFLNWLEE